jgi:hypothetical protein
LELEPVTGARPLPEAPRATWISKSDYARHRGCAPSYITKLINQGILTSPALSIEGKINPALADAMIAARRDPSRELGAATQRPVSSLPDDDDADDRAPQGSFALVKTDTEILKQRKLRLELDEIEGRLVDKAAVDRRAFDEGRRLRDRILAVPQQVAGKLLGLTDEREVAQAIKAALTAALNEAAAATEADDA